MPEEASVYDHVCAVSLKLTTGHDEMEGTASGILIDWNHGLVLTHASLLYPMVDKIIPTKLATLTKSGFIDSKIFHGQVKIEVVLPNCELIKTGVNKDKPIQISLLNSSVQGAGTFSRYKGQFKGIFECRNLRQTLEKLMPKDSWQFVEDPVTNTNESKGQKKSPENEELYAQLLPCFILIKLLNVSDLEKTAFNDINILSIRPGNENRQGDLVEICATPFGLLSPEVFLNSRSRGIVSNMAGPCGVLIMTDARCVPGCEGGALLYCNGRHRLLAGIMIASLCWKNNEWVGLSMACSLSELIGSLNQLRLSDWRQSTQSVIRGPNLREHFMQAMLDHITFVSVGHSWGTGIYIHPDTVITCSHVLKGHQTTKVFCDRHNGSDNQGCEIVYKTPINTQFDVAILKLPKLSTHTHNSKPVNFGRVDEGDVVYVIGHAIFRPNLGLSPTVTRGIVSKVINYNSIPIMIQTTCAVHAGASGGGVFNTEGELVALVVCNSRDTVTGACYPHVNMCVPMETISSKINQYLKSKDPSELKSLHIKNKHIQHLWSIGIEEDMIGSSDSPHVLNNV